MTLESKTSALRTHLPVPRRSLGPSALRLLAACGCLWVLGMLPLRLSNGRADVIIAVGWLVVLALVASLGFGAHRVFGRLDILALGSTAARTMAVFYALRRIGFVLLAMGFFLFWTLVYIGIWRWWEHGSFTGLSGHPYFSDFFYYAVSTGFISPPGDIIAASRGARTATMTELLTGTAALAVYLGSFLGASDREPRAAGS